MIVVDASVLSVALVDDGKDGDRVRQRLRGETLAAPELIDLEIASALRRHVAAGKLSPLRAEQALADLVDLPLQRARHTPLVGRCWELRQNVTPYDASYVALAELLGVVLVTSDARLTRAPGVRCATELIG